MRLGIIKDGREYAVALRQIDKLMDATQDSLEADQLKLLAFVVEIYEDEGPGCPRGLIMEEADFFAPPRDGPTLSPQEWKRAFEDSIRTGVLGSKNLKTTAVSPTCDGK